MTPKSKYMIPCPAGSTLPDKIRRPSLFFGHRNVMFVPCTGERPEMCPLCGGFICYFDSAEEAAEAWADYLAGISWKSPQWDTLKAMGPLGLLPKAFAERLHQ